MLLQEVAAQELTLLVLRSLNLLASPVFLKRTINFLLGEVAELGENGPMSVEADDGSEPLLHESVLYLCVASLLEELAFGATRGTDP